MNFVIKNIFFLLFLSLNCLAQKDTSIFKPIRKIELMVFPTLIYNSINIGYSWQENESVENVFTVNYALFIPNSFGEIFKVQFNKNKILYVGKKETIYLPLFVSAKRFNFLQFEGENSKDYYNFCLAIGSGFGVKLKLREKETLRVEFGLGAALNMINEQEGTYLSLYKFNKLKIFKKTPLIPAFRFNIRYLINLNSKKKNINHN